MFSRNPQPFDPSAAGVATSSQPQLFDEAFMQRLEQLTLVARRVRAGRYKGERRSTKRGSSVEFADYRNYTPGDDLRRLDWRIFARLERPFIKLFEETEDQTVHLVLDSSASMQWPGDDPAVNKWIFARRLAAALSYITLAGGDRLTVSVITHDSHHAWGPNRGRNHIHALLAHFSTLAAEGPTDLNTALRHIAASRHRTGLLFFLSDMFSTAGYEQGLAALGSAGYEINVLHLLSPDEIEPDLVGDLRLYDIETGVAQEVSLDPTLHRLYRQRFTAWQHGIESYCLSRNINYVLLNTEMAFDAVIAGHLRQRGFVR